MTTGYLPWALGFALIAEIEVVSRRNATNEDDGLIGVGSLDQLGCAWVVRVTQAEDASRFLEAKDGPERLPVKGLVPGDVFSEGGRGLNGLFECALWRHLGEGQHRGESKWRQHCRGEDSATGGCGAFQPMNEARSYGISRAFVLKQ